MGWFTRKPVIDPVAVLKESHERVQEGYERQIALLQEQLADARADAQRHCERADHAVDYLYNKIGLQAISESGKRDAMEVAEHVRARAERVATFDPFEDRPFDSGEGVYSKIEEAII